MFNGSVEYLSKVVGLVSVDLVGLGAKYLNTLSAGEGKQVTPPK